MQNQSEPPTHAATRTGWEPRDTSEEVFGRRMRQERERLAITQGGLANGLGELGMKLDPTAVTRIEKGDRGLRLNEALAIAQVLGCTLDYLLDPYPTPSLDDEIERLVERLDEVDQRVHAAQTQAEHAQAMVASAVQQRDAISAQLAKLRQERDRAVTLTEDEKRQVEEERALNRALGDPDFQEGE
jgi:transcriptional regulator with XRE-family HTH domain